MRLKSGTPKNRRSNVRQTVSGRNKRKKKKER